MLTDDEESITGCHGLDTPLSWKDIRSLRGRTRNNFNRHHLHSRTTVHRHLNLKKKGIPVVPNGIISGTGCLADDESQGPWPLLLTSAVHSSAILSRVALVRIDSRRRQDCRTACHSHTTFKSVIARILNDTVTNHSTADSRPSRIPLSILGTYFASDLKDLLPLRTRLHTDQRVARNKAMK